MPTVALLIRGWCGYWRLGDVRLYFWVDMTWLH